MPIQDKVKKTPKYLYIAIPLAIVFVVYLWNQRTINIKRDCSRQAESSAHQLYLSQLEQFPLANKQEIQQANEEGIFLTPAYEFEYERCLELKGL
jgi:hypothetical protein